MESVTTAQFSSAPQPLLSVIVVNWNGGALLDETLDSLMAQTLAGSMEIVLVDNASTDGSQSRAVERCGPSLRLVQLTSNQGFAGGNNAGFAAARGSYFLLLNNDAVAAPDWAERLLDRARADTRLGMVTSRILCASNPKMLDNAGHDIFADGLNRSRGHMQPDAAPYDEAGPTLLASGCAALYRADAVRAAGGFDEDFFAYGDDTDLGLALRFAGWGCIYEPAARVLHHGSSTAGRLSPRKVYLIERNRVWVLIKYFPLSWILASPWHTARRLFAGLRAARGGNGLARELTGSIGPMKLGLTICRAWFDALRRLPVFWRKRRAIWRRKKLTNAEIRALLKRHLLPVSAMTFAE
ncbi:MAG: glycosyltransferase family 2 protein [Lentisphaerae bacterium]|nr:glycosyltransferase family 2 protein [Lentisphaerota bacterium]